jgi:hypothetical protein
LRIENTVLEGDDNPRFHLSIFREELQRHRP